MQPCRGSAGVGPGQSCSRALLAPAPVAATTRATMGPPAQYRRSLWDRRIGLTGLEQATTNSTNLREFVVRSEKLIYIPPTKLREGT